MQEINYFVAALVCVAAAVELVWLFSFDIRRYDECTLAELLE